MENKKCMVCGSKEDIVVVHGKTLCNNCKKEMCQCIVCGTTENTSYVKWVWICTPCMKKRFKGLWELKEAAI